VATTLQSVLSRGEDFYTRIRVLSEKDSLSVKIYYRGLGERKFAMADLKPMANHVFEAHLPAQVIPEDFEYYIQVETDADKVLFPATAGNINLAVVIL
jgi:hypothetical protein